MPIKRLTRNANGERCGQSTRTNTGSDLHLLRIGRNLLCYLQQDEITEDSTTAGKQRETRQKECVEQYPWKAKRNKAKERMCGAVPSRPLHSARREKQSKRSECVEQYPLGHFLLLWCVVEDGRAILREMVRYAEKIALGLIE
jgi:hypothetical protein